MKLFLGIFLLDSSLNLDYFLFVLQLVESFGGATELHDIGEQTMHDGSKLPLPPVLFTRIPAVPDPTKKTVGIYGHLDVQPALKAPFLFSLALLSYSTSVLLSLCIV